MRANTMWRGILTKTYIDKEREPGKTLLIITDKRRGISHPDPNAAWKDAEEMLEEAEKEKQRGQALSICIRPADYGAEDDGPEENIFRRSYN